MSIGLERAAGAPAVPLRSGADDAPSSAVAPQERVSLSAEARRAARALPRPPASAVRWYRAPRLPRPAPPPLEAPRSPRVHAAVAAYRRQVGAAA